jgi:hypothetical protein
MSRPGIDVNNEDHGVNRRPVARLLAVVTFSVTGGNVRIHRSL